MHGETCVIQFVSGATIHVSSGYTLVPILEKTVKIINKLGLHARPTALLVQETSKYLSTIELEANGLKVNGKSIMGVLMLAAAYNSDLKIFANGDDAEKALSGIEALIKSKFDEE